MNKKIKILHVTSSLKVGGAETVLCQLISQLKNDFEHHVIYFHGGPNVKKLHDLGIKTYQVKGLIFLYDPIFFIRFFLLIRKLSTDIIHSLLWAANVSSRLASWLTGIPNVSVYHNNIDQNGAIRNFLDRITIKKSGLIITVSTQIESDLKNRIHVKNSKVIKNGIDVHSIHNIGRGSAICKSDLGIDNKNLIIGSVGRLHPVKNFPLLLNSFDLVRRIFENIHLVIIGVGKEENRLKELAYNLGIYNYVTFIIGKQAYPYYPIFDFFVQSSDKEGISMALLEAMSFSIPCLVTSVCSFHPVIVNEKNGIIVEAGNNEALSSAISALIKDDAFARQIGMNARDTVIKHFSSKCMVDSYRETFSLLANRKF